MNIDAKLQEVLSKKVKDLTLDMSASLESLGLDSLDKIDLLYDIEDVFGIEFSNVENTLIVCLLFSSYLRNKYVRGITAKTCKFGNEVFLVAHARTRHHHARRD